MATGIPKAKSPRQHGKQQAHPSGSRTNGLSAELSYPGKRSEAEILSIPPASPAFAWSCGSPRCTNALYFGDNLPILAHLARDPAVKGKVKLIYIDPPFATKMLYQSRSLSHAYCDLLSGANYIEFLRSRLIFLRELLAETGSVYVHLDENMAFHIKLIMDEIFGPTRYRNWITRKKCNPKNYTRKTYGNVSDFILFYTKTDSYVWNRSVEKWTPERIAREYPCVESGTGRRYKKVPLHAPGVRNGETGKPWRGKNPPPGKHWQFPPAVLEEMDKRGEIYWSPNGNPRRKVYLDQTDGIPVQDIWVDFRDAHNQNIRITGYPTEKNQEMVARIIEASSNPGDLVLDCFCGSGTTLAAASAAGRNWIGIDNSPEAIATCLRRFETGAQPMGDYVGKQVRERHDPKRYTRSFFDDETVDEPKATAREHRPILDFCLYSAEPLPKQLELAIRHWRAHFQGMRSSLQPTS